jgi:hypothetical protein
VCLGLGRLLRAATYSTVRVVLQDGAVEARKVRSFYAPLLVWMSGPLFSILDSGVRVLPQREWEQREREIYRTLHGTSIRVTADGVIHLPRLTGVTLAALLEDPALEQSIRNRAIELSVFALAALHRLGFTHGDAMAENVMVDLEAGVAHWFDFETVHVSDRSVTWQRADDVRALLATCVLRAIPGKLPETVRLIADAYGDDEVIRLLPSSIGSVWRRPLAFHLGQAGLSFRYYREIACVLEEHLGERPSHHRQSVMAE